MLAAVATAAVLLITEGSPLPAPHAADLSPWEEPVPGSVRLAGLDAPDPGGGPVWDIRISHSRTGETCTAVGQIFGGKLGVVGLDDVFRALPVGGVDACGVPGIAGPVLAGARVFVGRTAAQARTVVNGVAGEGARSVTVYGPGRARHLRLGVQGSFITVYRGYVEEVRPRLVVVDADGRSSTISFASSYAFEVADPDGGAPWQISAGAAIGSPGAQPDENCAQASQQAGRTNLSGPIETALTPDLCGSLGSAPLFVSMRRFDPGDGQGTGTPWGDNPARTLVYGAAAPRVRSLTLLGAGAPRALAIDPHGGAFLAVLDGHVSPASLTLLARLRDGHLLRYTRSSVAERREHRQAHRASAGRALPCPRRTRILAPAARGSDREHGQRDAAATRPRRRFRHGRFAAGAGASTRARRSVPGATCRASIAGRQAWSKGGGCSSRFQAPRSYPLRCRARRHRVRTAIPTARLPKRRARWI